MKKRKFFIATVMLGCILTACNGDASNTTSTTTSSIADETTSVETSEAETTEAETESSAHAMGETAPLKNWNITVSNVQILDSVENGYGHFDPEEGNKYLLVTATAENTGKEADTFLPSFAMNSDVSAKVLYGDGYEFSMTQLIGYSRDLINSTINPLSSKEGDMAFEIPNSVADSSDSLLIEFSAGNDTAVFTLR